MCRENCVLRSFVIRVLGGMVLIAVFGEPEVSRADEKVSAKDLDFFEKSIRPVLVAQCYE